MSATLGLYRALTGAVGAVAVPVGRRVARPGSPWRGRWGRIEGLELAAGGPWIHAASLGEALGARCWGESLLASGYRAPMLVTTRTLAGLERVRREWKERAVASIAPIDFPQAVRRVLDEASPMRLDLLETELWPNLLAEAHRAGVPVVVVSGTVSARTASRLHALGLGGRALFGPLHVLAQSERDAARYRALGVAAERCAVIGDVKADALAAPEGATPDLDPASRRLVVFASARPGEEEAAVAVARTLAARSDAARWRYVVAPRHERAAGEFKEALARAGFRCDVRREMHRAGPGTTVSEWSTRLGMGPTSAADPAHGTARSVGLLVTKGELAELFGGARVVLVGGTFAPWGGHNVLEPAAHGAPVLVGPHHADVEAGVALLASHGGGSAVPDAAGAAATLGAWLDETSGARIAGALAAAAAAQGASRRGLDKLAEWGLVP
ncbi:MAG TPA: glycosyltransferase N-terminal domain-containing protein [Candidatus Eisenbacteria bacterium]|nr:glycosyltransferase N-terminal domain-containing protein [Candidatus Eisenbacteria bacterium]